MARLLAILLLIITLSSVYLLSGRAGWFPEQISEYGDAIDRQFMRTLIVVGIAFVLAQLLLAYYVLRYRDRGAGQAIYSHGNNKLEITLILLTTVTFVALAGLGQKVWAQLHFQDAPADALQIEVTAQQFAWNIRYPGADGKFGRTNPKLISDQENPVGMDPKDEASKDDVVAL